MYFVWWLKIFTIKSLQLSLIRSIYLQNEAACLSQCKQGKADAFIATAMSCSRWNLLRIFIRYVALVIFKNVKKRKQIFMKVKEKLKSGRKFKKKTTRKTFCASMTDVVGVIVVVFTAAVTVLSSRHATVKAPTEFNWTEWECIVLWTVVERWPARGLDQFVPDVWYPSANGFSRLSCTNGPPA